MVWTFYRSRRADATASCLEFVARNSGGRDVTDAVARLRRPIRDRVAALFLVDFIGAAAAKEPLPESDGDVDDDDYVEYILRRELKEDCDTQPLRASRLAAAAASRKDASPLAVSWSTSGPKECPRSTRLPGGQADTESAPSAS